MFLNFKYVIFCSIDQLSSYTATILLDCNTNVSSSLVSYGQAFRGICRLNLQVSDDLYE